MLRRLWMVVLAAVMGGFLLAGCQTAPPAPDGTPATQAKNDYTKAEEKINWIKRRLALYKGEDAQLKRFLAQQACEVDRAIEEKTEGEVYTGGVYTELVNQYNRRFNSKDPKSGNSSALTAEEAKYCGDLDRVRNAG